MGLRINQNIEAFNSYRNLSTTQGQMAKSLEKLSSGFRINRAADDAAGLAISEGLRSQVGGLKQASRNAQDGISVVQTAEGALTEVHAILQRMRDLAVQAGNDSNNAQARTNINTEYTQLKDELGRIASSTNFNGTNLLNGAGTLNFQVGADGNAASQISVDLSTANISTVVTNLGSGYGSTNATINPATVTGNLTFTQGSNVTVVAMGAVDATRTLDEAINELNSNAAFSTNYTASKNADGTSVDVVSKTGSTAVTVAGTGVTQNSSTAGSGVSFTSAANAQSAITTITTQITSVSTARANLGAYQNRFEHTINNLNVAVENLSASESRIRDTDMATEMMSFTRSQILSQAGTAMLAQANQASQGVLQLLR